MVGILCNSDMARVSRPEIGSRYEYIFNSVIGKKSRQAGGKEASKRSTVVSCLRLLEWMREIMIGAWCVVRGARYEVRGTPRESSRKMKCMSAGRCCGLGGRGSGVGSCAWRRLYISIESAEYSRRYRSGGSGGAVSAWGIVPRAPS